MSDNVSDAGDAGRNFAPSSANPELITVRPGTGLEVDLTKVNKTHLPHGGRDFLSMPLLFMDDLNRFFPKAEIKGNAALYHSTKFEGGPEVASTSVALSTSHVPMSEIRSLEKAWQSFVARKNDPKTDPRARDVMEHFRLPDPKLEPEFYRVYGPRW